MKLFLNIFAIVTFLYFAIPNNSLANDLYGPKIFGLQLGMPYQSFKPIIDDICAKYNYTISKCEDSTKFVRSLTGRNDINVFGNDHSIIATWYNNKKLAGYTIPLAIFNYNRSINVRPFLEELANNYNLQFDCDNNGMCLGNNNSVGYTITIDLNKGTLSIKEASKMSDLQFK